MSPAQKPAQPSKKAQQAPKPAARQPGDRRVVIAAVLGVILLIIFLAFWVGRGLGNPSVPKGDIAKVSDSPEGNITKDQFDRALVQAAARQGLSTTTLPKPSDPQYTLLKNQAISDLLDVAWIEGEARARGVEVTDRDVSQQLDQIKKQNFSNEGQFKRFIAKSGFTPEDVNTRVKLQLLSQRIQQQVAKQAPKITSGDVKDYYNANSKQFEQPEQRDVRLVLNKDKAKVDAARAELEKSSSDATWSAVAKKYSTDAASKDNGGQRAGLTKGLVEQPLDDAIFAASTNQIQGPVKTPLGYYVFEVSKITPAQKTKFDTVKAQIQQQLTSQAQQNAFNSFIQDYRDKWTNRTVCASGYEIDRCDNFTAPPQACPKDSVKRHQCPAPVTATRPLVPGTALPFSTAQGPPQGPHPPGVGAATPTLPGGVPGGIPGAVPGAAGAPTGAPPGAPPGATAPGGAPPGATAPGG